MLHIDHNGGFFSCCTIRLEKIIEYFNKNKQLPLIIDSSEQYRLYKYNNNNDITFDYFMDYKLSDNFNYINDVYVTNENMEQQFSDYKKLNYNLIEPFINKYFEPSNVVKKIIQEIEEKYNIDYENTCVVFYRGNCKQQETNLPSYNDYIEKINTIQNTNKNITFLFQSDETEFLIYMNNIYNNNIILNDYIRHINKNNYTETDKIDKKNNLEFSQKYLAITIIMARCKYIICNSGNCSLWIALYRFNSNNIIQYLNPLNSEIKNDYWI